MCVSSLFTLHIRRYRGSELKPRVSYFKIRAAYDDFYCILLHIVKIGVLSFASAAQDILVDYLCAIDPEVADWYQDYWFVDHGWYCLCHVGFARSNNNMGVEVDWRNTKKLCPPLAKLGTFFISILCLI